MRVLLRSAGSLALILVAACGANASTSEAPLLTASAAASGGSMNTGGGGAASVSSTGAGGVFEGPIGGDRPVIVSAPPDYDPNVPAPLLLLLHGYSGSGDVQELYLDLDKEAASRGYLFAHPDGTKDKNGLEFWNATDACCDFGNSGIDDSTYLAKVIAQITQTFNVDPKRIHLMGHSNGAFMAHRMACDHADAIASIAALSGAQFLDLNQCKPSEAVNTLVIHGTLDPIILYAGGNLFGHAYPGPVDTAKDWVHLNGCDPKVNENLPPRDLTQVLGAETKVMRWSGCENKTVVEHWRIEGSGHLPLFKQSFKTALFDFFDGHPKP